ncbi:hypothetical protein B0H66DRAFT_625087 [Apodospora peruviana]|uniref:CST complex subunit Stn1 N-terminal domain-containing protein n=1 Tax=Apodospora peruviana TaxID=516989 RepID=A0AAE0I230_9PEZI|nr:hypothetical protein B0H66DRAFT_625087 [Apodospora peruviana]
MTNATELPTTGPYPIYCFHLSPTLNRYCHLRITDVVALSSHPGFRGQDMYFYLNHPIKWVRISGVVVGVDEFEGRRVYTIDDSSGATIECVVSTPLPLRGGTSNNNNTVVGGAKSASSKKLPNTNNAAEKALPERPLPVTDGDIDVGHVIDIKGSIKLFRESRQVHADKITHLRSTEQEVKFWEKLAQLRKDVLNRPWVLDRRELRRCRKEAEGYDVRRTATGLEKRKRTSAAPEVRAVDAAGSKHDREGGRERVESGRTAERAAHRLTGLEKKRKISATPGDAARSEHNRDFDRGKSGKAAEKAPRLTGKSSARVTAPNPVTGK